MPNRNAATILCIGASDSSGSTGIQMDVKTAQAFGCQAKTVVTCLYARNQSGARARQVMPDSFVQEQIKLALEEEEIHAVKVGDLCNQSIIRIVAETLEVLSKAGIKVVVDPVLSTHCGTYSMDAAERAEFKKRLPMFAEVFTPSLKEAESLSGVTVSSIEQLEELADTLHGFGPKAVVLRGGKIGSGDSLLDVVLTAEGKQVFETTLPLEKYGARGVGAATATAIACGLAQAQSTRQSIDDARRFVNDAMRAAKPVQGGTTSLDPIDAMKRLYELGL